MVFTAKNNTKSDNNTSVAVIAEGTKIIGEMHSNEAYIYGELNGKIISKGNITIGSTGNAKGEIDTSSLVLSGKFEGKCTCDTIEILNKGSFIGNIICNEFIIEKGGFFEGETKRKNELVAKSTKTETSKKVLKNI